MEALSISRNSRLLWIAELAGFERYYWRHQNTCTFFNRVIGGMLIISLAIFTIISLLFFLVVGLISLGLHDVAKGIIESNIVFLVMWTTWYILSILAGVVVLVTGIALGVYYGVYYSAKRLIELTIKYLPCKGLWADFKEHLSGICKPIKIVN